MTYVCQILAWCFSLTVSQSDPPSVYKSAIFSTPPMRAQTHTQPQSHRISHSPWRQQHQAGSPKFPAAQGRRRTRIRGLGDPQVSLWIRVWLLESLPESAEDFTARKEREKRRTRRRRERRRCSGPGGKEKSASSKLFLPSGCQLFRVWVLGAVLHMTRVWPGSARLFLPLFIRPSSSFHRFKALFFLSGFYADKSPAASPGQLSTC